MALRNSSATRGVLGSCGRFGLPRQGGTALTTRSAGTRRVRVPMLPFAKVPLGPRAISTVCARSVASCLKSLSSGVICTILNQISGSVRLDRRLVDRDIRGRVALPVNPPRASMSQPS